MHEKAMPVLLTDREARERWLNGSVEEALALQGPAPDGSLSVVAAGLEARRLKSGCLFFKSLMQYSHPLSAERRPGQLRTFSPTCAQKSVLKSPAPIGASWISAGRRGCAGDSARPATHGRANRGAGRAPDRKRYETPDRRANAGARRPARHGASAGIRVPMSIPIVISTVIGRVGDASEHAHHSGGRRTNRSCSR